MDHHGLSVPSEIKMASAAAGQVNLFIGFDAVARLLLLRQTNDSRIPYGPSSGFALARELAQNAGREIPEAISRSPDWLAFLFAAAVAAAVIIIASPAKGNYEGVRQFSALSGLLVVTKSGIFCLLGMAVSPAGADVSGVSEVTPLVLLGRSMMLSGEIDERFDELFRAGQALLSASSNSTGPDGDLASNK